MRNLFLFLILFSPLVSVGQDFSEWEEEYQKLETNYAFGKYYQSLSNGNSFYKKMSKKGWYPEMDIPTQALLIKYSAALGNRIETCSYFDQLATTWIIKRNTFSDSAQIIGNLILSGTAAAFGKNEVALEFILSADSLLSKSNDPKAYWLKKIQLLQSEIYTQTLEYPLAMAVLDTLISEQERLISAANQSNDSLSFTKKFLKRKGKLLRDEILHLADLYVRKADIVRLYGDYFRADSLYGENTLKFEKWFSKREPVTLFNSYGKTLLNAEIGNPNSPGEIRKIRQTFAKNIHFGIPNRLYLEMFEEEMIGYLKQNNYSKYSKALQQYQREILKNFGQKSIYYFNSKLWDNYSNYFKGKYDVYEKNIIKLSEELPEFYTNIDAGSIPFLQKMAHALESNFNFLEADSTYHQILEIVKTNSSSHSPLYYQASLELGSFYSRNASKFDLADSVYSDFFLTLVSGRFHPLSDSYNRYLGDYGYIQLQKDQFQLAVEKYQKRSRNIQSKYSSSSENYAVSLADLARAQIALGKYSDAEKNLLKADVVYKTLKSTKSISYAYNLKSLGDVHRINGDFINSNRNLIEGLDLANKFSIEDPLLSMQFEESLAQLNIQLGNYLEASEQLTTSILFKERIFGNGHPQLINPYRLLSELYLAQGKIVDAEKEILKTMRVCSDNLGSNSLNYYRSEETLVHIYHAIGMNKRALDLTNQIISAYQKKVGKKYLRIAEMLIVKTKLEFELGFSATDLNSNLNRASQIITYNVNDRHPQIAEVIELKALVYRKENKTQDALIQLQTANLIFTSSYGNTHPKTADNQVNIANLYFEIGNYINALAFYGKALSIYEPLLSNMHPKYLYTKSKIGWTYYAQNQLEMAVEILRSTTSSYSQTLRENFPFLSMDEKNKFWEKIWPDFMVFNSLAIDYYPTDPTILRDMFNLHLETKSILFRSAAEINRYVQAYGTEDDKLLYQSLRQLRDSLGIAQSQSIFNHQEEGFSIQETKEKITQIEKKLSEEAFLQNPIETKKMDWTSIRNALATNEVAVEIIRVEKFLSTDADSITYVALILNRDSKNPEIVVLPNGDDLESRHFNYYQNNMKQQLDDVQSYTWYWEDFEPYLRGKRTIYLSTEGIYSQINPETFKNRDGVYLMDRLNFYTLSSTSELLRLENYPNYTSHSAFLVGNPKFNSESKKFNTSFPSLPGAEIEVKEIEKILGSQNYEIELYTGENATEGVVKKIKNQRILHLATHGYFSDTSSTNSSNQIVGLNIYEKRQNNLQSGLLFAGADSLLLNGSWETINRGDGVLTSLEAMNLDLNSTELVFLSACETGKTSHQINEGIGGFQNAFRVAGAKNVIMTLFKVDDEIAQELATDFYRFWMQSGSKRLAFIEAKKSIRQKYKDPFYWGAFVMLGLD